MTYACQEPDCFVTYTRSDGYFVNTRDPLLIKEAPIPRHQYCLKDSFPMYLLEVQPDQPSFRPLEMPEVQHEPWRRYSEVTYSAANLLSDSLSSKQMAGYKVTCSPVMMEGREPNIPISCGRQASLSWISQLTLASPPSAPSR